LQGHRFVIQANNFACSLLLVAVKKANDLANVLGIPGGCGAGGGDRVKRKGRPMPVPIRRSFTLKDTGMFRADSP